MGSRYYESCAAQDEIKPGKISKELREALNLPENDVPIWIYRMRALGYPPGWLRKAIVDTNDIFDTDVSKEETGSRKRKNPSEEIQYDHSKLIEYPGFNSPMPEGCTDYHYYVNMPAMLEHQQLEYAKKHMNAFKPAPLPKRTKITPPTDDSGPDEGLNSSLVKSNTSINQEDPDSPSDQDPTDLDTINDVNKSNLSASLASEIKLLSKGSPLPKTVERAPLEKFSQGVVGELLYFENIPNSTGKFDTIRGLLNSMRKSKGETDVNTSFDSTKSEP